jgi:hypothetical protein
MAGFSKRALEQWRGQQQRAEAEDEQEQQIFLDGDEAAFLEIQLSALSLQLFCLTADG